jgi:hypothetical protein
MTIENRNTPIHEKFLDRNDLVVLEFNNGYTFAQVEGWEQYKYDPYSNIGPINPEDNSGFQRLESGGDDILHVESGEEKLLHVAIGHSPGYLRRYTNYPEGQTRLRTPPNLDVPRSTAGHEYGYIDGDDSPYENPTDAQELLIPPGVHLDFDFYNPDQNESVQPILNIMMREYNVGILDPNQNGDKVRRAMSPGTPIPTYPVGSIDSQVNFASIQAGWDIEPTLVNRQSNRGGR